jgi:hypothetical protein
MRRRSVNSGTKKGQNKPEKVPSTKIHDVTATTLQQRPGFSDGRSQKDTVRKSG